MKIITLTLSPAFDLHCTAKDFSAGHENLVRTVRREAGGKGVNISRALQANGTDSLCLVLLGSENGDEFKNILLSDRLNICDLTVSGSIRENITVHTDRGEETRISFDGFETDPSILKKITQHLEKIELCDTFVTFTGRAPKGISIELIKGFLKELQGRGARIVIDSRSFSLDDLIDCSPYLIKPNEEEISAYMGRTVSTLSDAATAAKEIQHKGVENVIITLGEKGAVLACRSGIFTATAPKINALSTIGAGDSTIAGFLSAISEGLDEIAALKRAVAYGSAACLTEGTQPPRKDDIERIIIQISTKISNKY